ncbi:LuxR C-terminal-related transcriptional regulator [Nonomuraea mangrovi]|uniref:LuxR C-terminal-related transcriptional regulator n=1 Tax=Nonomuraea mangrovi TaxID=2316207 RepID=A0ABW4TAL6_9ACTN
MAGSWPFAGRAAELAEIRSAAAGLVVVGAPGVGKSRLVAQAVGGLDDVAWVRATAAAAELPLGAFGPLLPSTPPAGNPLGWAADAVRAPVLVVDDAHLLDAASAALVHHLVARGRTRVIATLRTETPAPDAVRALWKDDLLPRMELAPLTAEETGRVLERALGGRVEPGTVTRLWHASRGNALYLRELVLAGMLADSGGVWRWRGPLSITPSLRDTIAGRVGELTPDEREVLELLAYGEPLGADLLSSLASAAAVERLEDRQLVTVELEGRRLQVRLGHPLYGEVIRHGCGTLRARKLLRKLADAVAASGLRRREDVLRVAVWRLDSGAASDPELLLAACDLARMARDLELAEHLARAAGDGFRARLALGSILFYADRYAESEEAFAAASALARDDSSRTDCATTRAFNLFWGLGRVEEALELMTAIDRSITDADARQGARSTRSSLEVFAGDLEAARASLRAAAAMGPSTHPRNVLASGTTEAVILAAEGRATECLETVARTEAALDRAPNALPSLRAAILEAASEAALFLGDLAAAERYAEQGRGLDGEFGAWAKAIIYFGTRKAQALRLRGSITDALGWCREAIARLPERSVWAGLCLGELAHAHAMLGEVEAAEEAIALAERRGLPLGPPVVVPVEQAKVWTLAARGDISGAVSTALAAAERALPAQVPFLLHDVVRLGRPAQVAARLTGEGPLVALFAEHAAARTGPDLDAVSAGFERLGLIVHAAEAAAQAALRHRHEGLTRAARAAETRAWALARRCQGARTPALLDLDVPDLTPRQREVALLAAQGLTNREIAARLVVSIRTVANTLYAVYEKTGVSDRAALADLLG